MYRILIIADPKISVPPIHYGGAERIIALLAKELQSQGHRIDLIGGPGSQAFGGKLIIHKSPTLSYWSRAWRKILFQWTSLTAAYKADIVINFGRTDYLEFLLRTRKPLICNFQNPVSQDEIDWILSRRKENIAFIGVSKSQIEGLLPHSLFSVIYNASEVSRYNFQKTPDTPPYLVFLGRITSNKGADIAISVARRSGLPLKLAGTISDEPGDREFFDNIINPQLGSGIDYIGPVNDSEKNKLLGGASALVFPIRWKEPCALTVSEALSCGTPVIATRYASTPEVVEHGKTGFLCDSEDELVESATRLKQIDRVDCRQAAENQFSAKVVVREFLKIIEKLILK